MWLSTSVAATLLLVVTASQEEKLYTQPVDVFLQRGFADAVLDEGSLQQKLTAQILTKHAMEMLPGADDVSVTMVPLGAFLSHFSLE